MHIKIPLGILILGMACATGTDGDQGEDGCTVGSEGCPCTTGGACNPGLECMSGICVDTGGTGGAGGGSSTSTSSGTGGSSTSTSSGTGGSSTSTSTSTSTSSSTSGAGGAGGVISVGGMGGSVGCPDPPTGVSGCPSCGTYCDCPWSASWSSVTGATHYLVKYTCIIQNTYQATSTSVDLCTQVGMANDSLCANGAGAVTVEACNTNCCSSPVTVPSTPLACGGGVCCG